MSFVGPRASSSNSIASVRTRSATRDPLRRVVDSQGNAEHHGGRQLRAGGRIRHEERRRVARP